MLSAKAEGDSRLKRIAELYMEYQKRLKRTMLWISMTFL